MCCTNCGAEIEAGSTFCTSCGQKVEGASNDRDGSLGTASRGRAVKPWVVAVILVAVLGTGTSVAFAFRSVLFGDKETANETTEEAVAAASTDMGTDKAEDEEGLSSQHVGETF